VKTKPKQQKENDSDNEMVIESDNDDSVNENVNAEENTNDDDDDDDNGSHSYNFTDRWSQISRTFTHAMNSYAEDVRKNWLGNLNDQRNFHRRLQFEHALGEKMQEILEKIQFTIKQHKMSARNPKEEREEKKEIKNEEETRSNKDSSMVNALLAEGDMSPPRPKKKGTEETDIMNTIEESIAELKLVKDALLGNLEESMIESWLNFKPVPLAPADVMVVSPHNNGMVTNIRPLHGPGGLPPPTTPADKHSKHPAVNSSLGYE